MQVAPAPENRPITVSDAPSVLSPEIVIPSADACRITLQSVVSQDHGPWA
ncbi:hypothetical protein Z946_2165 [Sulfitobacter noctilucicola]|nr:hypothetical protein Z946_2165 [Sulfitobacter noctilucicola]